MLIRLKQFQCFISVLFHHVRRALGYNVNHLYSRDCGGQNLPSPIDKAHRLYNSLLLPHKPWWLFISLQIMI